MEAYIGNQQTAPAARGLQRLSFIVGAAAVVGSLVFIALTLAGYGTLRLNGIPSGATVRLNGHLLATTATVRLRSGSYTVSVASPRTNPTAATLHIDLFRTTTYRPTLQQRDPAAIASSVLGAIPGTTQTPAFSSSKWFGDDWLAGQLGSGQPVIALHYSSQTNQWGLAYCTVSADCAQDKLTLPPAVATYIHSFSAVPAKAEVMQ